VSIVSGATYLFSVAYIDLLASVFAADSSAFPRLAAGRTLNKRGQPAAGRKAGESGIVCRLPIIGKNRRRMQPI
jgi:hypothetical protein